MATAKSAMEGFYKKNGRLAGELGKNLEGVFGKLGLVALVADVAKADTAFGKLKAGVKGLLMLGLPLNALFGVTLFKGMKAGIHSILKDTGSLEAALNRLGHIQSLQRAFAPFVGGIDAAKRKVAELVNFAARSNFSLGDVGGGAMSLQKGTRGSFAGVQAMTTVGDAAAASGNTFEDASTAVAEFYDTLRGGGAIEGATERLRGMGMISQATADDLVHLQASGASVGQVFGALTTDLQSAKGAMTDVAGELASVNKEHDKLVEEMQTKFASPWVEADIENTKNMNAAMQASLPLISSIGSWLNMLTSGFSTAGTAVAKWVAESAGLRAVVQTLVIAFTSLIAVISAVSAISLGLWLSSLAAAVGGLASGVGVLSIALRALQLALAATGVGLIALVALSAAGILVGYTNSLNRATEAVLDHARAQRAAEDAIRKQMASMKTLTDYHEALAAALALEQKAEEDLAAARKEARETLDKNNWGAPAWLKMSEEQIEAKVNENEKVRAAQADKGKAGTVVHDVLKQGPAGLTTASQQALARATAERAMQQEEDDFQRKLSEGGADRVGLLRDRAKVLAGREKAGVAGAAAAVETEKTRAELGAQLMVAERNQDAERVKFLKAAIATAGMAAPADSSTYLRTQAQLMRDQQLLVRERTKKVGQPEVVTDRPATPQEAAAVDLRAEIAAAREADTATRSDEFKNQAAELARAQRVGRAQQNMTIGADEARRGPGGQYGDLAGRKPQWGDIAARDRGEYGNIGWRESRASRQAVSLADQSDFASRFEQLRGTFGDEEAKRMALRDTSNEIAKEGQVGPFPGMVASSLQRIGGGGGYYEGPQDPSVAVQERIEDLQKTATDYLKIISEKGEGVK